jgi:UDP-N-acetylglucosamine 4,6-dehydratase
MILDGKRVLITGGTGSLGRAILKRAQDEGWNTEFTVFSRTETKIAQVKSNFPNVRAIIADVRDLDWLRTNMPGHDVVIHAAALKIVPVAEINVKEAITTNVEGTKNVAIACAEAEVERAILISSDKSCGPTYYGVTKRLGEGLLREANNWRSTEFLSVRYGNVLRSSNSLVSLFERLIAEDKPFTITDFRMTRFWLSMQQAIDLILYALENSKAGTITVPKAPAMSVVDLAKTLDPDRELVEIGIRPGERLNETLIVREEAQHTIDIGSHFVIYPPQDRVESNLPFQFEYTSDKPAHWLTPDEMRELLKDS